MGGSDQLLAVRAARGDRRAFEAIYRRYRQPLYRFCLAMTGNVQDAQDALQNTMVKVLRALPGEQREIRLKPWLYRIARNESLEARRRRQHDAQLGSDTMGLVGVAETVETRERLRSLLADLAALPERQRATLVMREMAGLEFAEIALAFGTSQGAMRQTLYEARLRLRELESERELGWDEEIERRSKDLVALAPASLPLAASLAGAGAGTAGKAVASSALFKLAATVVASVAIVTVADRAGLVNLPVGGPRGTDDAAGARVHVVSRIPSSFTTQPPADGKERPADVDPEPAATAPPPGVGPHREADTATRVSRDVAEPSGAGGGETTAATGGGAEEAPVETNEPTPRTEPEPDSTVADQSGAESPPQDESTPRHGHGPPPKEPREPPDNAGSPPGKSEGPPGKPESPPGKPEAPPGKPEAPPGKPETPGGKPETPPGRS